MASTQGTIRLFRLAGITVFLHWSWFLVAVYEIQRGGRYSWFVWSVLEYVALFAIVTLHEFGHALACRQVGGRAEQIILWPLGGIAYVAPPPRPGATLWSIAAGPLVNIALIPVLGILYIVSRNNASDLTVFLRELSWINLVLLLFNALPIYPLDGGQVLRSLLWFVVGRARSLTATAITGFIGVAGIMLLAIVTQSIWLIVLAAFAGFQCFNGYKQAQVLKRLEDMPRHEDVACPSCKAHPPRSALWVCGFCGLAFDTFESNALCPGCSAEFSATTCVDCGASHGYSEWIVATPSHEPPRVVRDTVRAPSFIIIVLGCTACLGALVLVLLAALFFRDSSSAAAKRPQYEAEIDRLWLAESMTLPGQQTLILQEDEVYDAYVEGDSGRVSPNSDGIEIDVIADTGNAVPVSKPLSAEPLQRNGRILSPAASFQTYTTGPHTVRVVARAENFTNARVKIGISSATLTSPFPAIGRGLAVATTLFALIFATIGIFLFQSYSERRKAFQRSAVDRH